MQVFFGLLILNIDDHNDFELSQEKMECHGTKLYTYTPKNETSSLRVVASTDKLTGVCASFLVTGLTKYEIVNKSTLEQFNVFYAFEPYFLKVIDRQLG